MAIVPAPTLRRWIERVEAVVPRLAEEMAQRLQEEEGAPAEPGAAPAGGAGGPPGAPGGTARPAAEPTPPPRYVPTGRLLGAGGQAAVSEAEDALLGRTVALKRGGHAGVYREARRGAALFHPAILPVLDFVRIGGGAPEGALVMPVAPEGTLAQRLAARRGRPWRSRDDPELRLLLRHWRRLVEAAGYLHDNGVVHADVKPANVLLGAHGEVFLHDLGIAGEHTAEPGVAAAFCGTPGWVPAPPHPGADHRHFARDTWQLAMLLACITHGTDRAERTPLAGQAWHPRGDDPARLGATLVAAGTRAFLPEDPTFATAAGLASGAPSPGGPTPAGPTTTAALPAAAAPEGGPTRPASDAGSPAAGPSWLAELDTITRLLAADRAGDPRVVLPALDAWEAGGDVPGHPYGRLERVGRSLRRHPTRLAIGVGLGLLLVVLGVAAYRAELLGAERDRELRRRLLESSLALVTRGADPVPVEALARELLARRPDPEVRGAWVVAASMARPTLLEASRYTEHTPVGWAAVSPEGVEVIPDDTYLDAWSPDGRTRARWAEGRVEVEGPAGAWSRDGVWRDPIVPLPQDDGSVVGGSDGELVLYRADGSAETLVEGTMIGFARAQGGPFVAVSSSLGDLGVFDLRTHAWVRRAVGARATAMAVEETGRLAAFSTPPEGDRDHRVHLWDTARDTWTELDGHAAAVKALAFLDGRRLVSADVEGGVRLWEDGHLVAAWQTARLPRFLPLRARGDEVKIAGSDGVFRTWSVAGLRPERAAEGDAPQRSIAFDVQGHPWTVGDPGALTHWRPDGPVRDPLAGSHGVAVAVSRAGEVAVGSSPGHLWVRRGAGEARAVTLAKTEGTNAAHVNVLGWAPDGGVLAIGSYLGARALYRPATDTLWEAPVPEDCGSVLGVDWRPDGREVVMSHVDGCVLTQPADGTPAVVRRLGHTGIGDLALDPSGHIAAMGSRDSRVVLLWDVDAGRELRRLEVGEDWANVVDWAGDELVACTTGGDVYLWDTHTWELRLRFRAHRANCSSARFGPDGALWTTGGDGRLARWDIAAPSRVPGFDI